MSIRLIECVPNFSEGRNTESIDEIRKAIENVEGVRVLNVDPGEATNRTVITFVGTPEAVTEAAYRSVKRASEVIDMRKHHGAHPRIGATDVLPLVPVAGVSLEECAKLARNLAERIWCELGIPTYCYEAAAYSPERKNLAFCRRGEYESLPKKMTDADEAPDYGAGDMTEQVLKSGATVVGARDYLIAVNFNLNTTSVRRANAIAFDVREKGRPQREGNSVTGKVVKDEQGRTVWIPGTLKGCKAIGWYIDEYGVAQVSMNITDINATPLHVAFEEVCRAARERGIRVTGTEIIGLVPKRSIIDAGKYFLRKQSRSVGVSEREIIKIAIKSMGLDDLAPFDPDKRIIENLLASFQTGKQFIDLTVRDFTETTASESAIPGGGSTAAYIGSLAAALGTMVANISAQKAGWDEQWEFFSDWAEKGERLMQELLGSVDENVQTLVRISAALSLPNSSSEEKVSRNEAIQKAALHAAQVPLKTMHIVMEVFDIFHAMVEQGNPSSISDIGVGALAARSAVWGAYLNVKTSVIGLKDRMKAEELISEAELMAHKADSQETEIIGRIEEMIS